MEHRERSHLGVAALLCASILLGSCDRDPTVEKETKTQKYAEVVKSFTGKVTADGGEHAGGIRKFFDDFGRAASEHNPARLRELFDSRMTLRLLKQQDMLPRMLLRNEARLVRLLEQKVGSRLADPVTGVSWARYEIRQVRFIQDETEALVYSRHWDANDISSKMRWWLFRTGGKWRAYDFELLEGSIRISTLLGIGFKMAGQKDSSVRALPGLLQAMQEAHAGDPESALATLQKLDGIRFPAVMESMRLVMIAVLLSDQMRCQEAIQAADRAVAHNRDLPLIHLIYGASHNGLKQYEKALTHAERYAGFLGKDADYYEVVGEAYRGMGRTAEAIAAYRSGLTDDPQSGNNVLGLIKTLPADKRGEAVKCYTRLNGLDEWFVGMAEQLVLRKDTNTLRTLIEVHKSVRPDDENIRDYEDALKELEQDNT